MRASLKKRIQWTKDLFFAVTFARHKLSKYYTEVTPTIGMLLISALILDPRRKLRSFMMWNWEMNINPKDEAVYTTQYQEAFHKYVENEYCTKTLTFACHQPRKRIDEQSFLFRNSFKIRSNIIGSL
jgi:hypothetical protein